MMSSTWCDYDMWYCTCYCYRSISTHVMFSFHRFVVNTLRSRQNDRLFADDTFKRIFLNEILEFRLKFHWSLFLRVLWTIFQHWFWWWLGADQATSHYLNQCRLDHWRIYASLGLNELIEIYVTSDSKRRRMSKVRVISHYSTLLLSPMVCFME